MFLLPDRLRESDRCALYDSATASEISYKQLFRLVGSTSAILGSSRKLGFCFCKNDLASVVSYLSGVQAGHAVALFDAKAPSAVQFALLQRYRPDWTFGTDRSVIQQLGYEIQTSAGGNGLAINRSAPELPVRDGTGVLLATSGSTGNPKFVRLARSAVEHNAMAIVGGLGIDEEQRAPTSLPIHYSYGLSVLNTHLRSGARVVLIDDGILTENFWRVARQQNCTSFAGVPYSYQMLRQLDLSIVAPPSLLTFTQAGGKLDPKYVQMFHEIAVKRGGRFFVMYGQTEATARITILPADFLPEKLGSAGREMIDGELRIEANGQQLPLGQIGEVVYAGPNVMLGYAECREDLQRDDELKGELHTGDLGYLDPDRCLFITGRAKRIAKVFGLRVNLDDIEAMVRDLAQVAAVAGDDQVVIFTETGDEEVYLEHRKALASRLAVHHSGFAFRKLCPLPMLPNGKVNYQALAVGAKP